MRLVSSEAGFGMRTLSLSRRERVDNTGLVGRLTEEVRVLPREERKRRAERVER
jgi:hypothetical protein